MALSNDVQALLVAFCGGMVAALYKFSQERKRAGSDYDIIDFILLSISGSFAGFIGYCVAKWQLEDPFIVIALTGIASTGGYAMLDFFKESFFTAVRNRLGVSQQVHMPEQFYRDVSVPGRQPMAPGASYQGPQPRYETPPKRPENRPYYPDQEQP